MWNSQNLSGKVSEPGVRTWVDKDQDLVHRSESGWTRIKTWCTGQNHVNFTRLESLSVAHECLKARVRIWVFAGQSLQVQRSTEQWRSFKNPDKDLHVSGNNHDVTSAIQAG